jgi:hypothetical protein
MFYAYFDIIALSLFIYYWILHNILIDPLVVILTAYLCNFPMQNVNKESPLTLQKINLLFA